MFVYFRELFLSHLIFTGRLETKSVLQFVCFSDISYCYDKVNSKCNIHYVIQ